jgi:hypothetical protein
VHLPIDDLLPVRHTVTLTCPCDEGLARAANDMTRPFYGGEAIEMDRYLQWLDRNPYLLAVLTDDVGQVEGYFDILPLEPAFLDDFISGRASEADMAADVILPPSRMHECRRLYLGGIAVRDPGGHTSRRHASMLIWGMLRYLQRFYGGGNAKDLLAIASTAAGERLLRGFRFRVEVGASKRIDRHDLFSHPIDRKGREVLAGSVPDWGGQCVLALSGFEPEHRIFVSYRREDSMAITGRLVDRLRATLGADTVFFDVETIGYGLDFRTAIDEALATCQVVLAVVGPRWLESLQQRTSNGTEDHVVTELARALHLERQVLPILVDGASLPNARDLPVEIQKFAYRNALAIDAGSRFEIDTNTILDAIRALASRQSQ